jgi:hypothetical protein
MLPEWDVSFVPTFFGFTSVAIANSFHASGHLE